MTLSARSSASSLSSMPSRRRQYGFGIGAKHGRRPIFLDRRVRKFHRTGQNRQVLAQRMLDLYLQAACLDLRIVEHLPEIVDRPARHVGSIEYPQPFVGRPRAEDSVIIPHSKARCSKDAGRVVTKRGSVGQFGMAERLAQASVLGICCRR